LTGGLRTPKSVSLAETAKKPTLKDRLYPIPVLGTALRLQDRYKADDADQHAGAIGFFGFLSLFPLLLLALSVAGFVLADDPRGQADFADALTRAIPGFAGAFGDGESSVQSAISGLADNAGSVGLIGLVSLLATGLKVVNSAHRATLAIFHLDVQSSGLTLRVRQVGVLVVLGVLAVLGVAATALVGAAATLATDEASAFVGDESVNRALQVAATVAGLAGSLLFDFVLFVGAYKLLSVGRGPSLANLWPGALLAAFGWTGLKAFGATYVTGQISKTDASIGALGGVVGLLLLLYLAGRVFLYGAELASLVRTPGQELAQRYDAVRFERTIIGDEIARPAQSLAGPALVARRRNTDQDNALVIVMTGLLAIAMVLRGRR
jgi:membrane protein